MTLPELAVGMGVFSLLLVSYFTLNLGCLQLNRFESTRFRSANQAMSATSQMLMEMRGAASNYVGNLQNSSASSFKADNDGTNQSGNALLIIPSFNFSNSICYYYSSNCLYRSLNRGTGVVCVSSITNSQPIFQELLVDGRTVRTNAVTASLTAIRLNFTTTNQVMTNYYRNPTNYLSVQVQAYPRNF